MLAGTSSFGMSGVNAHLFLSIVHEHVDTLVSSCPCLHWQRSRHFIASPPHPMLELACTATCRRLSFSFRLKAATIAALHSCTENEQPVVPAAALLQMAAAAAVCLQDGPATVAISSAAFPMPAVLAEPKQLAANSIILLSCEAIAGELKAASSQTAYVKLMSASFCHLSTSGLAGLQPKCSGRDKQSLLLSLLQLESSIVQAAGAVAAVDSRALVHKAMDQQTAMLAASLSFQQPYAVLSAAALFLPGARIAAGQQSAMLYAHIAPSTLQGTDVRICSGKDQSCRVMGARFRPAGRSSMRTEAAQDLIYSIEMQAALAVPATSFSLRAPAGREQDACFFCLSPRNKACIRSSELIL